MEIPVTHLLACPPMPETNPLEQLLNRWDLNNFPTLQRIIASMDPIAWTLLILLGIAVLVGLYFTLTSRYTFEPIDEVETTPDVLLARLKQNPTRLSPQAIINRLGAEATLELLQYGDQIISKEWQYRWNSIREDLIRLLSEQEAFGPTHALARYYQSADTSEPDTVRIRRTALIHKLGQRRHLDPAPDGTPAQLRIHCHPAEPTGDLGFLGETFWLNPDMEMPPAQGPLVEMEEIDFHTLEDAHVALHIQRTPTVGGSFRLHMKKRWKMWVVAEEELEWSA